MKIAICVKHVPDGRVRMDPGTGRIDRSGSSQLNVFDNNAVEEALRVKGDSPGELVVISMGPEQADDALRSALALGVDRAVHVMDPAAAGSDLIATSAVLAKALERERADLILFGQQASDGGGAMLWSAVAERLRMAVVSQATQLTVTDGGVRVIRQTEFGDDVVEASFPVIVAVTDAINEPRYASLRGMMGAKRKPLELVSLDQLGVDRAATGEAGSKTKVLGIAQPPVRGGVTKLTDEGNAAQAIVDFLAERQLL